MMKKYTGYVRKLDGLGRVTLSKDIRNNLKIVRHTKFELSTYGDSIILEKVIDRCIFCNSKKKLYKYQGSLMCINCMEKISKRYMSIITTRKTGGLLLA